MRFVHFADCHVGGWRDVLLRDANARAFQRAVQFCIDKLVDFVLISGDLFNSAVPSIDGLQLVVSELVRLRDCGIPVYAIAGSHDFTPAGRTMLDVLESAGLLVNVVRGVVRDGKLFLKFTEDKKTGVKITGMLGKKGGLEREFYSDLSVEHLESEEGFKIFMFHSAIEELKPKGMERMEGLAGSFLPRGFDYYAGGHVHVSDHAGLEGRENIVFPGPLFPNNFSELEKLRHGTFCFYDDGKISHVPIIVHSVVSVVVDASGRSVEAVEQELVDRMEKELVSGAIVTLRVEGVLGSGRVSDLNWQRVLERCGGAYAVLKNSCLLQCRDQAVVSVVEKSADEIEHAVIVENAGRMVLFDAERDVVVAKDLMQVLCQEKLEGERVVDFEGRVVKNADGVFLKSV